MARTSIFESGAMVTMTLRVPSGIRDGYKKRAQKAGIDVSAVIRPILIEDLEKYEDPKGKRKS